MKNPVKNLVSNDYFMIMIALLIAMDIVILLDIPFLRQIVGFIFITFLPGLLIIQILKLNEIQYTEKIVLCIGLSISFLIFFGLLINNLSGSLGYKTPLATIPLLIALNIAFIVFAVIGYNVNKNSAFSLPSLNLTTSEKAFLIVPILFPALSIFGMHNMKTADDNIIVMFLLVLIPIYIVFVCFLNHKFPKRIYPAVIFLISLSLLLLISLRSNHIIIGSDTGREFYFFQATLNNLQWTVLGRSSLNACLSITLLPAIYTSILNMNSEFLYKILYPLIYSISPLVIYVLSKKYIGEFYAFLAACFFMFQVNFLWTASNARTNIAVLFFGLAMMTLFSDKIDPLKKRILFIVFMMSCLVSHYATTYIFFFILLGAFVGTAVLPKKYNTKNLVSFTIILLFFGLIFFWYSQVTVVSFDSGVVFFKTTLTNLNQFFIEESRGVSARTILGEGIMQKGIPYILEFVFTWLTFVFIGIGIITMIIRYKEMLFPELKNKKPDFLKEKFEVEYFAIAVACSGLLVIMVALPYIAVGYAMDRLYAVAITILSVFFVIGGISLSKLFLLVKEQVLRKQKSVNKRSNLQRNKGANSSQAYLIILLVLVPYFFSITGVTYQMCNVPHSIILDSCAETYNIKAIISDPDSYASMWIANRVDQNEKIFTTNYGYDVLPSQAQISPGRIERKIILIYGIQKRCKGYLYLRYRTVLARELSVQCPECKVEDMLIKKNKIYDSDNNEVWND